MGRTLVVEAYGRTRSGRIIARFLSHYHDKVTEGWINHVYPVNKGQMKRVDNQREWPGGLKVRSKGMIDVSIHEPGLVKPTGPHNIAKFETSQMVKRRGCSLNKKTTWGLLTWCHYVFRQGRLQKAELVRGCTVIICTVIICEKPYTSKTCGACGTIHEKLATRPSTALTQAARMLRTGMRTERATSSRAT